MPSLRIKLETARRRFLHTTACLQALTVDLDVFLEKRIPALAFWRVTHDLGISSEDVVEELARSFFASTASASGYEIVVAGSDVAGCLVDEQPTD